MNKNVKRITAGILMALQFASASAGFAAGKPADGQPNLATGKYAYELSFLQGVTDFTKQYQEGKKLDIPAIEKMKGPAAEGYKAGLKCMGTTALRELERAKIDPKAANYYELLSAATTAISKCSSKGSDMLLQKMNGPSGVSPGS